MTFEGTHLRQNSCSDDLGRMDLVESDRSDRHGRIRIEDERDAMYPMALALPDTWAAGSPTDKAMERGWRYWWPDGWSGNQGYTPHCVAYAWCHWGEDGPRTREPFGRGEGPFHNPASIYNAAQSRDRWPGSNYDGTSVRAGAKVLQDLDYIESYHWAVTFDDIVRAILTAGPVVVGTWWYESMYEVRGDGFLEVSGTAVGGHAYVLNGVNENAEKFRMKNSWGESWGDGGMAWIGFEDMEELFEEGGEACIAVPKGGR